MPAKKRPAPGPTSETETPPNACQLDETSGAAGDDEEVEIWTRPYQYSNCGRDIVVPVTKKARKVERPQEFTLSGTVEGEERTVKMIFERYAWRGTVGMVWAEVTGDSSSILLRPKFNYAKRCEEFIQKKLRYESDCDPPLLPGHYEVIPRTDDN